MDREISRETYGHVITTFGIVSIQLFALLGLLSQQSAYILYVHAHVCACYTPALLLLFS